MDTETARRLLDLTVEYRQATEAGQWAEHLDVTNGSRSPEAIAEEVAGLLSN